MFIFDEQNLILNRFRPYYILSNIKVVKTVFISFFLVFVCNYVYDFIELVCFEDNSSISLYVNDFESDNKTFDELPKYIKKFKENINTNLFRKTKTSSFIKSALKLLISNDKNVLTNYNYFGRTKFKIFSYEIKYRLNSYLRKKSSETFYLKIHIFAQQKYGLTF